MTLICKECGLSLEEEKEPGKYYCPNCGKYTDFFKTEPENESES
ncbi:MAG: hypothetical protein ACQERB_03980 [Promethearchaeati archaeon]